MTEKIFPVAPDKLEEIIKEYPTCPISTTKRPSAKTSAASSGPLTGPRAFGSISP